jgi:hypothetical protein
MPKKTKSAKSEGMSPEEVAAANQGGISFLKDEFPMLTMDQGQGAAGDAWTNMMSMFVPAMGGMVQSGYENFAANPSKTSTAVLADQTLGTNTADLPGVGVAAGGEEELSPYEIRIRELMANRGWTREMAVANQEGAMKAGGDINSNGAITNNEWARKLGSDFDNDGNVTDQEFAQWKQQNPDHQIAGGTKYKGLPGENGLFSGQAAPQVQQPTYQQPTQQQPVMSQGMPHQQQLQTGGGLGMVPQAPRNMTAHEPGNPAMQMQQPMYQQPTQQQPQASPQMPPVGLPQGYKGGFLTPKRRGGGF